MSVFHLLRRFLSELGGLGSGPTRGSRLESDSPDSSSAVLRVLGRVRALPPEGSSGEPDTGLSQPKRLALLVHLALSSFRGWVRRDEILGIFWPEMDETRARHALSQAVYVLRMELGSRILRTEGKENLRVDPQALWCDAICFERAIQAGRLEEALKLYEGPFLPHFYVEGCGAFDEWVERERARLKDLAASAAESLAERAEARGALEEAVHWRERYLELAPYDEAVVLALLDLLERIGDRSRALHHLQQFAERLEDLELEPTATLVERVGRITGDARPENLRAGQDQPTPAKSPLARAGTRSNGPLDTESATELRSPLTALRRRRILGFGITLLGLGALGWSAFAFYGGEAPSEDSLEIRSLAVLPLENLAPDPEAEQYFADGMTEALITELSQISALTVISRTSAMHYRESDQSLPTIARELGVEGLIVGSVLRAGDKVRITLRLVHGATDQHLWSESYERDMSDILALQGEVARTVAEEIRVTVTQDEASRLASSRPVDPEAYTLYLKGNFQATRRSYPDAIEYYRQAIGTDSSFAAAHAGLALAYIESGWTASQVEFSQVEFEAMALQAKAAAMRALDLDPELPEAYITMGRVGQFLEYDWAAADEAFRRGMELSPTSTAALMAYHNYLIAMARFEEAVAVSRTMIERDPLGPASHNSHAFALLHLGRYSEALEHNARAIELGPNLGHQMLQAELYVLLERFDDAVASAEQAGLRVVQASARLGYVYAKANRREDALRILSRMTALVRDGRASPIGLVILHLGLDQKEAALAMLERGYAQHDPGAAFMKGYYMLDPLRTDQRFQRLLERMDFPQ